MSGALEKAQEATKGVAKNIGDTLIYALYPTTGMRFLRWKYGLEEPPPETRPRTLEEVRHEDELIAKAKAGKLGEKEEKKAPARGDGLRTFNVFVDGEFYKVEVEDATGGPIATPAPPPPPATRTPAPPTPRVEPSREAPASPIRKVEAPTPPATTLASGEVAIQAPMPGVIIRYEKKEGDEVKAGDAIVVIEAMKMENSLPSPVSGRVKRTEFKEGDKVARDTLLAVIEPL
jgi:pyruvate carboxylase subunit B